jgi:SAM-dependent methyltransferase
MGSAEARPRPFVIAPTVAAWLDALERRHLARLTPAELARALKALSARYVERRSTLISGAALDSAGKRAAFALYYAPLHFLALSRIVRSLPSAVHDVADILDVGCGTGAAGGAWAYEAGHARVFGLDRHPWAVAEANWTYRELRVRGRAVRADIRRAAIKGEQGKAVLLAYTVNELQPEIRDNLLPKLLSAHARGAHVLVVEPIARRGVASWWDAWAEAFGRERGREDEWRFPSELPARQRDLARAAGLDPRELTARTLYLG